MESAYKLNLETSGAKQKVTPLIDEAVLQRIRILQKALFCCYLVMITVRLTPIADHPCFEFHLAFKHSFQRRPLLIGDL